MVLPSFLPLPPFPPCFAINVCPCPCPLCCHDTKWQLRGQTLMAKHAGNWGKGKNNTTEDRAKISVSRARARAKIYVKTWGNGVKGKNDTTEAKIGQKYQFWGQGQNLDRQDTTDTNVRAKPSSAHVKDGDLSVKIMLTQWGLHGNCLQCKRLSLQLSLFVSLIWRGFRGGDGIYCGYGDWFFWDILEHIRTENRDHAIFRNLLLFSYYTNEVT